MTGKHLLSEILAGLDGVTELLRSRIGNPFLGECHLTEKEALSIAAYVEQLEKALAEAREFRAILEGHLSAAIDDYNEARRQPEGLSKWAGWDQSNMPWTEAKHKDRVCYAAFGETWSMEDAHALISFIDRTWGAKAQPHSETRQEQR